MVGFKIHNIQYLDTCHISRYICLDDPSPASESDYRIDARSRECSVTYSGVIVAVFETDAFVAERAINPKFKGDKASVD